MENQIEKLIAEGKALVGYDQEDVKEEINSLHTQFNVKRNQLNQEIERIKAENTLLKDKLDNQKEDERIHFSMEEFSKKIINVFLEDTLTIENLKKELAEKERSYLENLELLRNEKELAKQGIKEASDFLKSLQDDISLLKKEMEY